MIVTTIAHFRADAGGTTALVGPLGGEDGSLRGMGALRTRVGAKAARPHIVPHLDHD
jgi:hypothetical protein